MITTSKILRLLNKKSMKKMYPALYLSLFLLSSCNQKNKENSNSLMNDSLQKTVDSVIIQKENTPIYNQKDTAEEWLKEIFKTKESDRYFPDYNVEEKLCTKRFQEFIAESGELYGPSNLTDAEYPAAEKKYIAKWSGIYPIEEREMSLFGRGNGDIGELKQLKINKIKEGIYDVFIDYGNGIKTQNEVTLVSENGAYKIDYCKTKFLE
ncbi:hypothetical protein HMPREF0765_3782 [Sphingobacterium spiritivorum ATCC 33300]|uniref:DUF3828 domain-containing protein n=2 Tax=Sphingobacterium spiritivorum TaxID=258 RepID=C2G2H6_SPHSI|nr:hypothetical protein HMPREF0765_3782 [Sphingobacterium spiritivorum ATCC 33300]